MAQPCMELSENSSFNVANSLLQPVALFTYKPLAHPISGTSWELYTTGYDSTAVLLDGMTSAWSFKALTYSMSNPSEYTVGWICATPTESIAAQLFLDEEHKGPEEVSDHDKNKYTLGGASHTFTYRVGLLMWDYRTYRPAQRCHRCITWRRIRYSICSIRHKRHAS